MKNYDFMRLKSEATGQISSILFTILSNILFLTSIIHVAVFHSFRIMEYLQTIMVSVCQTFFFSFPMRFFLSKTKPTAHDIIFPHVWVRITLSLILCILVDAV